MYLINTGTVFDFLNTEVMSWHNKFFKWSCLVSVNFECMTASFICLSLWVRKTTISLAHTLHTYLLRTEFEGCTVNYGPRFPQWFIAHGRSARAINRRGKTGIRNIQCGPRNEVCKIFISYISFSWNRGRKNKVLDLAGRTVEYGPLNWPIAARVLSKRYNKCNYCLEMLVTY